MTQKNPDLISKLNQGPAVLFLGQNYLQSETGRDPFLADIISKYGPANEEPNDYSQIFRGQAQDSPETALSWMHERSQRIVASKWLQTVAIYSWSNVYTSAIDAVWYKSFRLDWRELQPIFEEKFKPADLRNRFKLHCTFLFGCVNQTEDTLRPPLRKREWLRRKQEAVTLALRLPEIITPFGVIIIEGYSGLKDWFARDDLIPILDKLNSGQVHIFSATAEEWEEDCSDLIQTGTITLYNESLAEFLIRAEENGQLQLGPRSEDIGHGLRVQVGEKSLKVPLDLWRQVSRSATVLDDSLFQPASPVSADQRYLDFRNFLALSSNRPIWSGYINGFVFHRDFEKDLLEKTNRALDTHSLQEKPIILHGQSGIGKTIALGTLAYEIRKAKNAPVIYIERKSQRPQAADIDAFCKWAEDNDASNTLIIWDGMLDVETYTDLLRYLAGRGRKVVLVGSCYRLEDAGSDDTAIIEAPANLAPDEVKRFTSFLDNLYPRLGATIAARVNLTDTSFLVALYRLLPETRHSLTNSLSQETTAVERDIQYKSAQIELMPTTALAYALLQAGLLRDEGPFSMKQQDIGGELVTEIQELIGLIMVPGQFGLKVPLELLMRTVRKDWISNFTDLVSDIDLFRWDEDAVGNFAVGPRHPLEAELIVKARLGGARAEVAYIEKLLSEIKGENLSDSTEINFAVDLIGRIGPNSRYRPRFAPHYSDISSKLKWLREQRGLHHPRLMLQEAYLLREYVIWQNETGLPPNAAAESLEQAETVLRQALESFHEERRTMGLRSIILVELGTTLASKTRQALHQPEKTNLPLQMFEDTRNHLIRAISSNSEDFHPLDVLFWITNDVIDAKILSPVAEAEAKADLVNFLSLMDPDNLDPEQRKRYFEKRLQLGQMLGQQEISDAAFAELLALGSKAGFYLHSVAMAGLITTDAELSDGGRRKCAIASEYLQSHRAEIVNDGRCLYALLKYWWMSKTGKPIFFKERQTLPFSYEDWSFVSGLLNDLLAAENVYGIAQINYLRGLAEFHLGSVGNAIMIFRELDREVEYMRGRRRIIRSYLASLSNGEPRSFSGTIAWIDDDGSKGEVYVEDLRSRIRFLPYEFRRGIEQKANEALNNFHIAFNFIGPIVEPSGYFRSLQSKSR